jgi:hypothetical protein
MPFASCSAAVPYHIQLADANRLGASPNGRPTTIGELRGRCEAPLVTVRDRRMFVSMLFCGRMLLVRVILLVISCIYRYNTSAVRLRSARNVAQKTFSLGKFYVNSILIGFN